MTQFEYISVAFSVVLALSAAQLLNNIRSVFDPARRYWVHGLWVVHLLVLHVITWWTIWAFRDVSWNLGSFSLALANLGALYVAANALVPTDRAGSLQGHFFANRTMFFTARGFVVLLFWAGTHVLLDVPLITPVRLVGVLFLVICAVGIASNKHRVQAMLAILGLANGVVAVGYLRFAAGSLGNP